MDIHALAAEYLSWAKKYGNGRNEQDLRFGQYICNLANITNSAIFNEENATLAFAMLLENP
jgi:hypothetical protein